MIYRLRYCNKDGVEARVDIQKGLATPVIEVESTERPFILSYNNDKGDKSGMFLSSSADIEIYETTDFNIDNLKTSNETELSVTHYINNVISWQGFIIPDFFSIEVRNNPIITMTASDRLGTLKSVTLSDLPSMISLRELAILCLNKTGLTLPLRTMADFNNGTGVNDFFNSKILTQRLSDTKGRSISCYDILSSILTASNSFLVQRSGGWHIINKIQHEAGSGKLYTGATSFINWSDVIFNFSDISVGGRRTIIPVASTVGVFHEFGGGRVYPENYDFSLDLTGWTSVNGFVAVINNRKVDNFASGTGVIPQEWTTDPVFGDTTEKKYLVNDNYGINYDFADKPYLRSSNIPVTYPNISQVKVNVEVNATGPYIDSETYRGETNFAVIASNGTSTLHLTGSGTFETLSGDPFLHKVLFDGDTHLQAVTSSRSVNGILAVQEGNLSGYNITVRIYGYTKGVTGGRFLVTTLVNSVAVTITDISDEAKGTLYKTERTDNYTKAHDIDTSLFADYLTTGLNGYFYSFPIDDTSLIYNSNNELTSKWTAYNDTEQLPLLQHVTRQRSRLFSVAHDLLSAEIDVSDFDPLAIFVACEKRYTVVSAQFDFFKSNLSVELEEVAFQSASVRDFIYSYFGDGESGIKSIGGISGGGGGGGTGGGLTPEQLEILSWWKKDPDRENTIFTEMNAYSTQELSAYGIGSGSGGGGGSLVTWGTTANNFSPLTVEGISKTVALQGHTHSKSEVGLSNVDNVKQLPLSQKGAVGGVAELDENGKVLASQLPSYVDDVLEYANLAGFPTTGETGKIYTALDTNKIYRWSGTTYIEISSSLALGETSSTAYRGDRGKIAYEHSQSAHAPANAQKNSDITKAEIEAKLTGIITSHSHTVTKDDVGLGNVLNVASYSKTETDNLLSSLNVGVTSIGLTAPTGFSVTNSPITSAGSIALAFATGYSLPTTAKQGQWDTAYTQRHTHANKTVLDGITSSLVSDWNTAFTNNHTHSNKTQLDLITQSNIDVLAKLSIVNGNLQIDGNAYATGELSAYGAGDGSGGGGGIIETVYGYSNLGQTFNNANLTDTFNAYTINQINTRLVAVESGSATMVNVSGTGDLLASVSKVGNNINFVKGNQSWGNLSGKPSVFAPSAHTHPISDITGLQAALNAKENTIAAGTTAQYWRGDKSWQTLNTTVVPEGTNLYYTNARVKAYADTLYSPLGHTHTIAQVTGLQNALNSKLETSIFNTHNNDNIRHITGAERAKWDTVVTDFGNLEIGGRNLAWRSDTLRVGSSGTGISSVMTTDGYLQVTTLAGNGNWHSGWTSSYGVIESSLNEGDDFTVSLVIKRVEGVGKPTIYLKAGMGYYTMAGDISEDFSTIHYTGKWKKSNPINIHLGWSSTVGVFIIKCWKLEKGNKSTDWTPAPEDQVSDWNTTDVNSFSFIKNKPTKLSDFTDNIGIGAHIANNAIHITSAERTNWNDANTKKHTHPNKPVIDQLTQADINVLAKLSLVDGNLKVDTNLYSTGEVSAYGIGSGSGGGGSLVSWGTEANSFIPLTVEGISKTVALLGHTHTYASLLNKPTTLLASGITDVYTKLETNTLLDGKASISALNSKLETTVFNTHNNDNIRHITGAERTKWDGVVGDFSKKLSNRYYFRSSYTNSITYWKIATIPKVDTSRASAICVEATSKKSSVSTGAKTKVMLGNRETLWYNKSYYNGKGQAQIIAYEQLNGSLDVYAYTPNLNQYSSLDVSYYEFGWNSGIIFYDAPSPTTTVPTGVSVFDSNNDLLYPVNATIEAKLEYANLLNAPTLLSQFTDNIGVATHIANKANPHSVTKAQVGLGNVDNTSDLLKPISNATQTALDGKVSKSGDTMSGALRWVTQNGLSPYIGQYATDGSFLISLGGQTTNSGLVLGGSSGNLLWKGNRLFDTSNMPTLTAGNGLTGGGVLNANRTITLGTPSTLDAITTNAVTDTSHTHAITTTSVGLANTIVQTDASGGVRGEVIRIGANWTLELVGTELQVKYNGALKQRLLANGSFVATGEVTAYE